MADNLKLSSDFGWKYTDKLAKYYIKSRDNFVYGHGLCILGKRIFTGDGKNILCYDIVYGCMIEAAFNFNNYGSNYLLGQEKEIPKNVTYILNDSISKNYIGKYKFTEGNMGTWFPKYLLKDSVLEIGFKDSVLYVMKNEKYAKQLYFFNRLNTRSSNFPLKKNHVFISSQGYYEFYKNGKLRIGAAGPETIWQRQ